MRGKLKPLTMVLLLVILSACVPNQVSAAEVASRDANDYRLTRSAQTGLTTLEPSDDLKYEIMLSPLIPILLPRAFMLPGIEHARLTLDFPNWTFRLAQSAAPGQFNIVHYDAERDDEGGNFTVDYVCSANNSFPPAGEVLQWVQFIDTTWAHLSSVPTPYIDPQPNDDNLPFYWKEPERLIHSAGGPKCPAGVNIRFTDSPARPLTRPKTNWRATLYLVSWDQRNPGTVTFYDGIWWGFDIRRVDKGYGPNVSGGVGADKYENVSDTQFVAGFDRENVSNITAASTELSVGQSVQVNVTVSNRASGVVENFTVNVYADQNITGCGDEVIVGEQVVSDLAPLDSRTLIFVWNTSGISTGSYLLSAEASVVPDSIPDFILFSPINIEGVAPSQGPSSQDLLMIGAGIFAVALATITLSVILLRGSRRRV